MDTKLIKEIISIVESSNICELEVEESGCRIRVGKNAGYSFESGNLRTNKKVEKIIEPEPLAANEGIKEIGEKIISPMLGVYYSSSSPQKAPFVKVGDKVKKGDVLCIIEAMKIMNEITAEKDGEIIEICAKNGEIIEYGQTILRMIGEN